MVTKTKEKKKKKTVSVSLKLSEEIFELLRDVSLARHFAGVASKAAGKEAADTPETNLTIEGIALVLTDLVEHHRDRLEDEAVKAGIKKKRSLAPTSSSRRD